MNVSDPGFGTDTAGSGEAISPKTRMLMPKDINKNLSVQKYGAGPPPSYRSLKDLYRAI